MNVKIRKMNFLDFFRMKRVKNDMPDIAGNFGNLIISENKTTTDIFKRFYETTNIFLSLISLKLAFSKYIVFLAENIDVVGILFLQTEDKEVNLGIVIDKDFRGMGIGKKLMEKAFEWSKENNKDLRLCAYEQNKIALNFYKKLGFKTTKKLYFMKKEVKK